ncbi:hypothetical protein NDU88_006713 [Pleurodeles waltl]|uniref:Uncharacterized protein n=1 Tax=Pleurodeles waltl TaxID=8319 RepID=A0AAV7WYC3_PLEWA|nr:hypothetical protein NDU88_006713 [Pleurodeles waltl]
MRQVTMRWTSSAKQLQQTRMEQFTGATKGNVKQMDQENGQMPLAILDLSGLQILASIEKYGTGLRLAQELLAQGQGEMHSLLWLRCYSSGRRTLVEERRMWKMRTDDRVNEVWTEMLEEIMQTEGGHAEHTQTQTTQGAVAHVHSIEGSV